MKLAIFLRSTVIKHYNARTSILSRLPSVNFLRKQRFVVAQNSLKIRKNNNPIIGLANNKRLNHDDTDFLLDEDSYHVNKAYEELYEQSLPVRHVIYPDSNDNILRSLNECVSIDDALNIIERNQHSLTTQHLTQAVLVFWDLQKMYHHVHMSNNMYVNASTFDKLNSDYIDTLTENQLFKQMLETIRTRRHEFEVKQLSYLISYLSKIGVDMKDEVSQSLIDEFNSKFFKEEHSLENLSMFMNGICYNTDLSFYYIVQQYVPHILNQLDHCTTASDITLLTTCLSAINVMLPNEFLAKYKTKVEDLIHLGVLNSDEHVAVIKTAMFLNYPQWRMENCQIISDLLRLLQGRMNLLNVTELLSVYEVFYKNQEPADILSEIQRCARKFLQQMEEEESPLLDIRLRLFSCIVYFTSPSQRPQFEAVIRNYIRYNLDFNSMLELKNLMFFTKIIDEKLCKMYWDKMLAFLDNKEITDVNLLKICHNYVNFEEISNSFRHSQCELKLLHLLEKELSSGLLGHIPSRFSSMAGFILVYSQNRSLLNIVIERIEEFKEQFNCVDCLNISQSFEYATKENQFLESEDLKQIKTSMDFTSSHLMKKNLSPNDSGLLIKAAICRGSISNSEYHDLWNNFKTDTQMTSRLLKSIAYCLYTTNTLLPSVLHYLTEYIGKKKSDLLGFNVERVLYLCYYLGHEPINSKLFFNTVTDVILRDQERLSGLSYLQACLSLSYFSVLPNSFTQQIFNTSFLDKLEAELENCYHKDIYPLRVRQSMMQLNRAVCLEYPEANVPWFHASFEFKNKSPKSTEPLIIKSVLKYLLQITEDEKYIHRDVLTHYGYSIEFLLHLDSNNRISDESNSAQRIGLLVMRTQAYTNGEIRLRGRQQLKIRHLEMMGYKIGVVSENQWSNLIYGLYKLNYLKDLIGLKTSEDNVNTVNS